MIYNEKRLSRERINARLRKLFGWVNEWADLIDQCHENYDGCRDQLLLVGQTVVHFGHYRKGTVFETEEVVSEEIFGMEVKHVSKQRSINQMYTWISAEIGVITG